MDSLRVWAPLLITLVGWAYSAGVLQSRIDHLEKWMDKTDGNRFTAEDAQNINQLYFFRLDQIDRRLEKLEDRQNGHNH